MKDKSDTRVNSINKQLGAQAIYLLKKILDHAFAIGGFERVLEVVGEMLQECGKTDRDARAFMATNWALKQLDAFAPELKFESLVFNLEVALRAAREANAMPGKPDANASKPNRSS